MINKKYNRFLQALIYLMFISAALHMCILFVYIILSKDATPANFFSIIGLNLFYPAFVASSLGYFLSYVVSGAIYIAGYLFLTNTKK